MHDHPVDSCMTVSYHPSLQHIILILHKFTEELATIALTEFDAVTRFLVRAARGSVQRADTRRDFVLG
jgi:hypothetical protein